MLEYVLLIMTIVVILYFMGAIKIIKENELAVVERLGSYLKTISVGIHYIYLPIDKIVFKSEKYVINYDLDNKSFVTKDDKKLNLNFKIDYEIIDPKLLYYGVNNPKSAISNYIANQLKNDIYNIEYNEFNIRISELEANLVEKSQELKQSWSIKITKVLINKVID